MYICICMHTHAHTPTRAFQIWRKRPQQYCLVSTLIDKLRNVSWFVIILTVTRPTPHPSTHPLKFELAWYFLLLFYWSFLYSAILCSRTDSLRSHVILFAFHLLRSVWPGGGGGGPGGGGGGGGIVNPALSAAVNVGNGPSAGPGTAHHNSSNENGNWAMFEEDENHSKDTCSFPLLQSASSLIVLLVVVVVWFCS